MDVLKSLCNTGKFKEALLILDAIEKNKLFLYYDSYLYILQGCGSMKALEEGKQVHAHIIKTGIKVDTFLGNALVNMYAKCGSMTDAWRVFNVMLNKNVITWNIMIRGYVKRGDMEEGLNFFWEMQQKDVRPDKFTFVSILQVCANLKALNFGKQIHNHIIKSGDDYDVFLGSALVNMYAKCGSLMDARKVFDNMPKRTTVSWNVMIAGYAQHGDGEEALKIFHQMKEEGLEPNKITFIGSLNACACLRALELGKQVHARIIENGYESDLFVGSSLVNMYAKCGSLVDACQVFDKLPKHDIVLWNALLAGYAQHGLGEEAFKLFKEMQRDGVKPDAITFLGLLDACVNLVDLEQGKQIHSLILQTGLESDIFVANSLINMYAKCGSIDHACKVFETMRKRDLISWNAMVAGYALNGLAQEAFNVFKRMQSEGVKPDDVTFLGILNACASLGNLEQGKKIHADIIGRGYESKPFVSNALIDMYAKCGSITLACQVFRKMAKRDLTSWNVLIAGYAQHGNGEAALKLFKKMKLEGFKPDKYTFIAVLNACASTASLEQASLIHACIVESGCKLDVFVENSLIDMYIKCGNLELAREVFDQMTGRDTISWTVMIAGYAQHGNGEEALRIFQNMQKNSIKPDDITFVGVLNACSHLGLVDESYDCFLSMSQEHMIVPTLEHYACMINILGRAGRLEEAENFIMEMPYQPNLSVWMALLGTSRAHGNAKLAKYAAERVLEYEPENSAAVVLLSNIFAASANWDDKKKTRKSMDERI